MNTPKTAEEMAGIASSSLTEKSLIRAYTDQLAATVHDKQDYVSKLESARGEDVFKYLLLISVSASESFILQTRIQAQHSFQWAKRVSIVGFAIIGCGVAAGIVGEATKQFGLSAAYLASIAGVCVELISGVFFYLYNRTLQQINLMHSRLMHSQELSTAILTGSVITDLNKRDDLRISVARSLLSTGKEEMQGIDQHDKSP